MKQIHNYLCASLCFLLALGGCAGRKNIELQTLTSPANFSGSWELDYKLTENSQEKLMYLYDLAMSQQQQQQAALRNDVKKGRVPNTPPNTRTVTNLQSAIALGMLAETMTRSVILNIEQTQDAIVVKREDDFSLTCDFTVADQTSTTLGEERCGFDDKGHLIYMVSLPDGLNVVHNLSKSADGTRLIVATTVSSERLPSGFTLHRVYMPFVPGKGGYQCEYTLEKKKTCWFGPAEQVPVD